jgi:hypothetical protein
MRSRLFWSAIVLVCLSGSAQAGYIEICKESTSAGALGGLSSFTINVTPGTLYAVPVGACLEAFQLPDGLVTITEVPQAGEALISVSTFPQNRLISFDPITGSAAVLIWGGSDLAQEVVVTFTNAPVPEPGTAWLLVSGLTFWAVRKKLRKRRVGAALNDSGRLPSVGARNHRRE